MHWPVRIRENAAKAGGSALAGIVPHPSAYVFVTDRVLVSVEICCPHNPSLAARFRNFIGLAFPMFPAVFRKSRATLQEIARFFDLAGVPALPIARGIVFLFASHVCCGPLALQELGGRARLLTRCPGRRQKKSSNFTVARPVLTYGWSLGPGSRYYAERRHHDGRSVMLTISSFSLQPDGQRKQVILGEHQLGNFATSGVGNGLPHPKSASALPARLPQYMAARWRTGPT